MGVRSIVIPPFHLRKTHHHNGGHPAEIPGRSPWGPTTLCRLPRSAPSLCVLPDCRLSGRKLFRRSTIFSAACCSAGLCLNSSRNLPVYSASHPIQGCEAGSGKALSSRDISPRPNRLFFHRAVRFCIGDPGWPLTAAHQQSECGLLTKQFFTDVVHFPITLLPADGTVPRRTPG